METQLTKSKTRLYWIDNLRFFAVACVVLFHVMNYWTDFSLPLSRKLNTLIIGFNIPVFFVLSGYVVSRKFLSVGSLGEVWRISYSAFVRMLLPAFFFTLLLVPTMGGISSPLGYFWFLHSLFRLYVVVACVSYLLNLLPIKNELLRILLLILISSCFSFVLGNYSVEFILYFIGGMLLNRYDVINRINSRSFAVLFVVSLTIFAYSKDYSFYVIKAKDLILHNQLPWIARQICGLGFSTCLCWCFSKALDKQSWMTPLGTMTLGIYLIHDYLVEFVGHGLLDIKLPLDVIWGWIVLLAVVSLLVFICVLLIIIIRLNKYTRLVILGE